MRKKSTGGPVSIGSILKKNKAYKPPSQVELRLINAAVEIRQDAPEEISYQHTVLCQTGLPYRSTDARTWEAKNGRVFLHVKAGELLHPVRGEWVPQPLPFGPKARLILIHLNSEAIRTQSRVIEVEDSMTAFLRQLLDGRDPNGAEIRKFKEQLAAVSTATLRLGYVADETEGAIRAPQGTLDIVDFLDPWFPKDASQRVFWNSTVSLSEKYFNTLINHAVPLDDRAIRALSHNAMALDIYSWLAQRLWRIPTKATGGQFVPWGGSNGLHEQFGHGYTRLRKFREVFLKTLQAVHTQYPDARIEANKQGLILHNSPPPVHRKLVSLSKPS